MDLYHKRSRIIADIFVKVIPIILLVLQKRIINMNSYYIMGPPLQFTTKQNGKI